jgi:membrane-associated phospholipid phosphatase
LKSRIGQNRTLQFAWIAAWLAASGNALASDPPAATPSIEGELLPVPNPSPPRAGSPNAAGFSGPPLVWKWSPFSTADYLVTLTGGALTLTSAIVQPRARHSLSGGILFDDAVRDELRAHSLAAQYRFRDASDVGLSLTVTWPFFADALTTAWWYRGSRDTAEQMALIDLEAFAIAGAAQGVTNVLVSRERPYGASCGSSALPANAIDCEGSQHYRSFFSGHATFAFTGAALVCVHHSENELLGAPWDALSCVGSYAVSATTATFRVAGDVHYASDVLLGALVGSVVGYGVPLLHYREAAAKHANESDFRLLLVPSAGGIGVWGTF